MVACPLVVNGVELVLSRFCFDRVELVLRQFCFDGSELWWRGWRDVLVGWCSTRARTEGTSEGTPIKSWRGPGLVGRGEHHQEAQERTHTTVGKSYGFGEAWLPGVMTESELAESSGEFTLKLVNSASKESKVHRGTDRGRARSTVSREHC